MGASGPPQPAPPQMVRRAPGLASAEDKAALVELRDFLRRHGTQGEQDAPAARELLRGGP